MTPELQRYYESRFDMMSMEGWKDLTIDINYELQSVQCECGGSASRIMSAPSVKLEGWSGHFPSAHMQFDHKHREKLAAERKATT